MDIQIIRSRKRRKTIQARKRHNRIEILAPAHMTDEQLKPHIDSLVQRIDRHEKARVLSHDDLDKRAQHFNQRYFNGRLQWKSIRWVTTQNRSYGSCTSMRGTIRLSDQLASMPTFVQDYVIIHELAHLLEPNHGPKFWALVNQYDLTERARGFLMGAGFKSVDPSDLDTE
ncbi:MAG: M48 family metallopeptidase [Phycisphaeraceae bacterium]|nr:M48 family metallopeptidase [Phycisphaeraceae bacterium]